MWAMGALGLTLIIALSLDVTPPPAGLLALGSGALAAPWWLDDVMVDDIPIR